MSLIQPNGSRLVDERRRRGFRRNERGVLEKLPLTHGFAKVVDSTVDPETAQEIYNLAKSLRMLSTDGLNVSEAKKIKDQADQIQTQLKILLEPLKPVAANIYSEAQRPDKSIRFYSEVSGLELCWRQGAHLSREQPGTNTVQRLTRGREHFALVSSKGANPQQWHDRAAGSVLAVDLRDFLSEMARDNDWVFKLKNNDGSSRFEVQLTSRKESLHILISPHRAVDQDSKFDGIVLTTTDGKSGSFPRLTLRDSTRAKIDGRKLHTQLHQGNGNDIFIEDYFQRMTHGYGSRARFSNHPISLRNAVLGLMNGELSFVGGVDGITKGFDSRIAYGLVDREQVAVVQDLVHRDLFYAERGRIAYDFVSRVPGFTMMLDEYNGSDARFGKGAVIYPIPDTKEASSEAWTSDLEVPKIVVNPSSQFLHGRQFLPTDWANTLVIFHSTNVESARQNRQGFFNWLHEQNNARPFGIPEYNYRDLGIKVEYSSQPKRIRSAMRSFLHEYELDLESVETPRADVAPNAPFDLKTNFLDWETGESMKGDRPGPIARDY